jgi:peroxiredoxin
MSLINTPVKPFKTNAFHNGKFIEVTEASFKGKWSVVIFMPAAFTFNCPTEVEDAAANYAEFQKANAEVYIVTTDTHFSHKVWHETSPAVGKATFPLVGDPTHQLTRNFDVHIDEEGLALRGTFVINPEGVIKTLEIHSNEIARDVSETLRKLKAAQYTAANPGQVCPAKWKEGDKTLKPSLDWSARSKQHATPSPSFPRKRESRKSGAGCIAFGKHWMPACAGMTGLFCPPHWFFIDSPPILYNDF